MVSHDLSAPLRAIVEFSKLLEAEQRDVLNADGKEYLALVVESGKKMQQMLAGMLDLSRITTAPKTFSPVHCNDVLNDCRIQLQDTIDATHATLEIAPLPTVTADAGQLTQLFLLLLENALKFHAPDAKPQVHVSAEKSKTAWVFTVRDNGIGIAPEFHERVFKPFQRLHGDDDYPGIGMGLTLARRIVVHHGGTLRIASFAGEGCSLVFTLPLQEAGA